MGPRRPPPLEYTRGRVVQDGEMLARISKVLGDCRFECECSDGTTRIGKIRGVLRGRMFVHVGDTVIASLRDFDRTKVDIVWRFAHDDLPLTTTNDASGYEVFP
jgi:translation initiation factor 1A